MKKNYTVLFRLFIAVILTQSVNLAYASGPARQYYKLIVYHFKDTVQEAVLDHYFSGALIPALHRMKILSVGVFKSLANDTASDKMIYVLIPFNTASEIQKLNDNLEKDETYKTSGHEYIDA